MAKHLKNRKLIKFPKPQTLEQQFLPAVLEITQTPPSPLGRMISYVIMIVFMLFILLACLTKVDIVAIAPGKIISNGKIKLIQPLKSGVVSHVYVQEGETVKQGQILAKIKFEDAETNRIRLTHEVLFAHIDVLRYQALLTKDPIKNFHLPVETPSDIVSYNKELLMNDIQKLTSEYEILSGQIQEAQAESTVLQAEIDKVKRAIPNLKETVAIKAILLKEQLVSKIQYLDLERQLIEYEETLNINQKRLDEVQAKIKTLHRQQDKIKIDFENDVYTKLQEAATKEELLKKELENAIWIEDLTEIKAPEDGVIQELEITTIGGIVTPAQTLMKLVPINEPLLVEATILNKDIGFVYPRQLATIKIDSFPYTKYGTINGSVLTISQDAITHEELGLIYQSRVSLDKDFIDVENKQIRLSPGMTVTVEIKTGKRRIIEYILAPFMQLASESLRER